MKQQWGREQPWRRPQQDSGSAVIEFIALGLLLMLPLLYLVIALGRIQAATFAADSSAREAARAFVTSDGNQDGRRRADIAVRLALLDQGFRTADGTLSLTCQSTGCLTPGSTVTVRVQIAVVLPGIPRGIASVLATRVTVRTTQVSAVDEFRVAPGSASA